VKPLSGFKFACGNIGLLTNNIAAIKNALNDNALISISLVAA
jgi:hypothetical protein